MLSKNKIKFIRSLEKKKFRDETACFLAEGNKLVSDLLPFFDCELLVAKPRWMATKGDVKVGELIAVEDGEIEKASLLKTPQDVLAVFRKPDRELPYNELKTELSLVLDGIQDPGNMGTIIRIADWFGIRNVICSLDSADIYNPKTIQATMGAIARVSVFYESLADFIDSLTGTPVYGTFLEGNNIYREKLTPNGLIVMGNEGKGISRSVEKLITSKLFIPNFPAGEKTSESLNVAVATAITCSEFRRRSNPKP